MKPWTQFQAIELCLLIESVAPRFGCHVALGGGCLYKEGYRKDCDVILYRIRQSPKIAFDALFQELKKLGIVKTAGFGFCHKAEFQGRAIDFLCPEEEGGEYPTVDASDKLITDDLLR